MPAVLWHVARCTGVEDFAGAAQDFGEGAEDFEGAVEDFGGAVAV